MWGMWFSIGLGAAAVLAAVAWAYRRPEARDPEWKAAFDDSEAAGRADGRKAWVAAVYALAVDDADPALRPAFAAQRLAALGVAGADALAHRVAELAGGDEDAWPLVQAIALWRLGVGRGWCPDAEAWRHIWPLARALQTRYSDFEHLAQDYLRGLKAAGRPAAEAAHVAQTVITLRAETWPRIRYEQPL
ncbi:MAG: DUF1266 domain-containing protein [Myxococcales bacterium]|nr:DUF1266 domain-containing protein [Myxococcales bacterium]